MSIKFRYFVHPRSAATQALFGLLLAQYVAPGTEYTGEPRVIEVNFGHYSPSFLVPESLLGELVKTPYARDVDVFFQAYGDKIRHFPRYLQMVQAAEARPHQSQQATA